MVPAAQGAQALFPPAENWSEGGGAQMTRESTQPMGNRKRQATVGKQQWASSSGQAAVDKQQWTSNIRETEANQRGDGFMTHLAWRAYGARC